MTSRAAQELAARAAAGVLQLQVCAECSAVQYPPRDVCRVCLSGALPWRVVPNTGTVLAATEAHASTDPFFRARAPWRIGLVALDCGPQAIVHLAQGCAPRSIVQVSLQLDHEGRAVLVGAPQAQP